MAVVVGGNVGKRSAKKQIQALKISVSYTHLDVYKRQI